MSNMTSNNAVQWSEGTDHAEAEAQLNSLLQQGWQLNDDANGIRKYFRFNTYTKVMDYANCIAIKSKRANHHSELTLKARSVTVLWTTHVPRGLSVKDLQMAEFCEMAARELVLAVEGAQEGEEGGPCGGA